MEANARMILRRILSVCRVPICVFIVAVLMDRMAPLRAAEAQARPPCIAIIDDVSNPTELKRHGIVPATPEVLTYFYNTFAANNISCTLEYLPIRQQAARAIPVVVEVPVFKEEPPPPPERGLKLPQLQITWKVYRDKKAAYDERLAAFQSTRDENRDQFVQKCLDALIAAEDEVIALQKKGAYAASDVEGTLLSAVSIMKTLRTSAGVLVLNTDLNDQVTHRRPRMSPFRDDELPPDIIRAIVLCNSSYRPDASPLLSKTPIGKYHAQTLKTAVDLVASLLSAVKATSSATPTKNSHASHD